MVEVLSDREEEDSQNKIRLFLKKHIQKGLASITWEDDALHILMDRNKRTLSLEEKIKLKFLITIGTPKHFRSKLWLICSGAKKDQFDNQSYYDSLVLLSKEVPSLYKKQIIKDIVRTQKGKSLDNDFHEKLQRILICYSIRNSSIGYCQGFNFICSRLLEVIVDEEDTFWMLVELIEEILPINYYSELAGVIVDKTIVFSFLKKYFPKLLYFFEENNAIVNSFIEKSLIGLFTQDYNEDTSLLIWDFIFLEGNIILIKTCLAVFGCIAKRLEAIGSEDIEALFTVFSVDIKAIQRDSNCLIHSLAIKQFEFNEMFLELKRGELSDSIRENTNVKNLEALQEKVKDKKIDFNELERKAAQCRADWPYCLNDFYFENTNEVIPYLIIHTKNNSTVLPDYFFYTINANGNGTDKGLNEGNKQSQEEDLLIERRPHYCTSAIESKEEKGTNDRKYSIMSQSSSTSEFIEDDNKSLYEKIRIISEQKCKGDEAMDEFDPEPFMYFDETPGE